MSAKLLRYLYDHIDNDVLKSTPLTLKGLCLKMGQSFDEFAAVKNGMTDAVMFNPEGNNILPAELYKEYFGLAEVSAL